MAVLSGVFGFAKERENRHKNSSVAGSTVRTSAVAKGCHRYVDRANCVVSGGNRFRDEESTRKTMRANIDSPLESYKRMCRKHELPRTMVNP